MKYGARNQLDGTVKAIKKGTVMGQVDLETGDGTPISSVMTMDTLNDLALKEGDKVKAVIKAVNVSLVRE